MSQYHDALGDVLLDQATQRLRDAAPSEIPSGLVDSTIAAIQNRPAPVKRTRGLGAMGLRWSNIAALVVAMAGTAAVVMHRSASVALAQVVDKVAAADSVRFVLIYGSAVDEAKELQCVMQGTKARVQHPQGVVMLADTDSMECLYLDTKNKAAGRFKLPERVAVELAMNPVEQLRQARSEDAKPLGNELIDGKNAALFRVSGVKLFGTESDKGEMRIWVDSASMLPLKIEIRLGETPVVTFKNLTWNSAIDPALMRMEIPDGYVEQPEDVFRKLLRPGAAEQPRLTPTEAFRKWHGESN